MIRYIHGFGSHSFDGIKRYLDDIRIFFEFKRTPKVMELYNVQMYKDTLAFALKAHGEQKTPNGLPYSFHIVSVANEIINSLSMYPINYDEANVAIACALLHDVNEDTNIKVTKENVNFLDKNIIDLVISGVEALTKNTTISSKQEQMRDSIERLKQMPYCVQMVKLADRITNLDPAPLFWNRAKRIAYLDEAKFILKEFGEFNKYLADKLQNKINNYEVDNSKDALGREIVDDYLIFCANDKYLILDKNNKKYLKIFKACNRLNKYITKKYNIKLFDSWENIEKKDLNKHTNRVSISYVIETLNSKDLLNLNKEIDKKIDKYFTTILGAEDVIVTT
jgi:hypothetical protein